MFSSVLSVWPILTSPRDDVIASKRTWKKSRSTTSKQFIACVNCEVHLSLDVCRVCISPTWKREENAVSAKYTVNLQCNAASVAAAAYLKSQDDNDANNYVGERGTVLM